MAGQGLVHHCMFMQGRTLTSSKAGIPYGHGICCVIPSMTWSATILYETLSTISVGAIWAPSQYPKRRLFVRSRKVSKPRDWYFKLSYRFEIWQAHRQHCCRSACQISERSDNSKYKSRGFETLRDLTERRIFGYWDGALVPNLLIFIIGIIVIVIKGIPTPGKMVFILKQAPGQQNVT